LKLTDADKLAIFNAALAGLCARPVWPQTTPKARDGSTKKVRDAFHLATWAKDIARTAVDVLEKDGERNGDGAGGFS
jgi:hypothetical protein